MVTCFYRSIKPLLSKPFDCLRKKINKSEKTNLLENETERKKMSAQVLALHARLSKESRAYLRTHRTHFTSRTQPSTRGNVPLSMTGTAIAPITNSAFERQVLSVAEQISLLHVQPSANQPSSGSTLTPLAEPPQDTAFACAFCFDTVEETPETRHWTMLPCCSHVLHMDCAKTALARDRRCGLCRRVIL